MNNREVTIEALLSEALPGNTFTQEPYPTGRVISQRYCELRSEIVEMELTSQSGEEELVGAIVLYAEDGDGNRYNISWSEVDINEDEEVRDGSA